MQSPPLMTDAIPEASGQIRSRSARHGHSCNAGTPFARLAIGSSSYEIAEAEGEPDLLAFRAGEQQEWTALDRKVSDGWIEVMADILLLDPDVLFEFLLTHAVRTGIGQEPPFQMEFDTLGVKWSARLFEDRDGEVRFGTDTWHYARLGLKAPADGRERAILILLATTREARARFEPHISRWARRIAQGVTVQPVC